MKTERKGFVIFDFINTEQGGKNTQLLIVIVNTEITEINLVFGVCLGLAEC